MKKYGIAALLVVLCLMGGVCAAQEIPHADFLLQKSHAMTSLMGELAGTEAYIAQYSSSPEILEAMEEIQQANFALPEKALLMHLPMEEIAQLFDGETRLDDMSEAARRFSEQRYAAALPSLLNGQQGVTKVAAGSILSVGNAYANPGLRQTMHVFLFYTSGLGSISSFAPNEEDILIANSGVVFALEDVFSSLVKISAEEEELAKLEEMGLVYEALDEEAIAAILQAE